MSGANHWLEAEPRAQRWQRPGCLGSHSSRPAFDDQPVTCATIGGGGGGGGGDRRRGCVRSSATVWPNAQEQHRRRDFCSWMALGGVPATRRYHTGAQRICEKPTVAAEKRCPEKPLYMNAGVPSPAFAKVFMYLHAIGYGVIGRGPFIDAARMRLERGVG